jgi:AcrR family transcriptional regulator
VTTERILETAIVHFGERGFDGASTRDIASASGTAMSSITYHFGGKQGLYLAVADHIATDMRALLGGAMESAQGAVGSDRAQAMEALLHLLDALGRVMLAPESAAWASFIIREQQCPTEAFERLYDGVMRDMAETVTSLVVAVRPGLGIMQARSAALFLYGQALVLRVARASVCRVLEREDIDPATADLLLRQLRANAIAILSETPA